MVAGVLGVEDVLVHDEGGAPSLGRVAHSYLSERARMLPVCTDLHGLSTWVGNCGEDMEVCFF